MHFKLLQPLKRNPKFVNPSSDVISSSADITSRFQILQQGCFLHKPGNRQPSDAAQIEEKAKANIPSIVKRNACCVGSILFGGRWLGGLYCYGQSRDYGNKANSALAPLPAGAMVCSSAQNPRMLHAKFPMQSPCTLLLMRLASC